MIHWGLNVRLHILEDGVEDGGEVGRSRETRALDRSLVELEDLG